MFNNANIIEKYSTCIHAIKVLYKFVRFEL